MFFIMKKHLQLLALLVALFVPWATQAQDVQDYLFSTDTSSSAWITLSNSASTVSGISQEDDANSGVMNIGFTFQFAGTNYTQWSCNSNGRVRLGSTAVDYGYTPPFSGQYTAYTADLPLIAPFTGDFDTYSTNGGARYELTGTAPNRIFVIQFALDPNWDEDGSNYVQVQLFEDSSKIRFVYGQAYATSGLNSFQIGLAATASDYLLVNPTTHTTGSALTTNYNTWPGQNRYYEFTPFIPTCPRVAQLRKDYASTDSLIVSWTPGGTETEWVLTLSDTNVDFVAYDTTFTFDNLMASHSYTVSVRPVCSTADTGQPRTETFRTTCGAVPHAALPWTEGFETWTTGSTGALDAWVLDQDPCWAGRTNYTSSYHYPYVNTSYHHSGSKALYGYKPGSSYYSYFTLPLFEDSVNTLMLSCWLYNASYLGSTYGIQVGVMNDPDSMSTFVNMGTIYVTATGQWQHKTVDFTSYTGTGRYITLMFPTTSSYNYHYIDDIVVEPVPACPAIADMAMSNVGIVAATCSWADGNALNTPADYDVELTDSNSVTNTFTATDRTITFTGLDASMAYTVAVRANCEGEGYGAWDTITFTTASLP